VSLDSLVPLKDETSYKYIQQQQQHEEEEEEERSFMKPL
jgi:hypothetical protein